MSYEVKTPPSYGSVPYMTTQNTGFMNPTGQQMVLAPAQPQMQMMPQMAQVGYPQMGMNPQMAAMNAYNPGMNYQNQQMSNCAMGNHSYKTEYGACGIITAVVLFPIGLLAMIVDKKKICTRCGNITA